MILIAPNGTYLEMGTGDSVASALMAAARGAEKTYLVDVGSFATRDMGFYKNLAEALKSEDTSFSVEVSEEMSLEDMLGICNAEYLTSGLQSLKKIEDGTVDFIWSHATLEHVRKHEFTETMKETFRILRPGGVASHNIDFKDHLGGALNNLRFRENIWEAEWMAAGSGFYTNRIRPHEIVEIFKGCGFVIDYMEKGRWDELPTPKK